MYFRKDAIIQNVMGQALAGAHMYVCEQPANLTTIPPSPLAMVWSDADGYNLEQDQPLVADGTGHFTYYAESDFYTEVYFYRGQFERVLLDQMVGCPCGPTPPTNGGPVPYTFALFSENVFGQPDPGMLVILYTAFTPNTFAANFSGSYATCGTMPLANAVYTVQKNGVAMGTITVSPSGTFTFTTAGFSMNPGDRLTMTAPSPMDLAMSDVAISLVGTRLS